MHPRVFGIVLPLINYPDRFPTVPEEDRRVLSNLTGARILAEFEGRNGGPRFYACRSYNVKPLCPSARRYAAEPRNQVFDKVDTIPIATRALVSSSLKLPR